MFAAVIPAAGTGSRFATAEQKLPKQYQPLEGAPIYMWSLAAFCKHTKIQMVVLVVSLDMLSAAKSDLRNMSFAGKEKISVIAGGASRQESVRNGIEHLAEFSSHPDFALIHDAARPFLSQSMIEDCIGSVTENGACTLAVPLTDTIKRVKDGVIEETLDRSTLHLIQTPQAGRFDWLLAAHRQAAAEGFATTDDAAILEYAGHKVSIVYGSRYNLKITNPEDLSISQALAPIILAEQKNRS